MFSRILKSYGHFLHTYRYTSQCVTAGTLWFVGDVLSQKLIPTDAEVARLRAAAAQQERQALLSSNHRHDPAAVGLDPRLARPSASAAPLPAAAASLAAAPPKGLELEPLHLPSHPTGLWGLDWHRVAVMTSFGLFAAGPAYTWWYRFLDRVVGGYFTAMIKKKHQTITTLNVSRTQLVWKTALTKVVADCILFDPPFLAFFFTSTNLMRGASLNEALAHLKDEFTTTYLIDLAIWTPIQIINFRWVPILVQPLVVNSFNVGWNTYLSYVTHRPSAGMIAAAAAEAPSRGIPTLVSLPAGSPASTASIASAPPSVPS